MSRPISNLTKNLQGQNDPGSGNAGTGPPGPLAMSALVPTGGFDSPGGLASFQPQSHEALSYYNSMYNLYQPPQRQPLLLLQTRQAAAPLLMNKLSIPIPIPTTTVLMDSALLLPERLANLWRGSQADPLLVASNSQFPPSDNFHTSPQRPGPLGTGPFTQYGAIDTNGLGTHDRPAAPQEFTGYTPQPDHYMTYPEFLNQLSQDGEDHLNIVDYPVSDLIMMLLCLLLKIIEANDKLHPNHFENTIAIRQRLKEERRRKRRLRLVVLTDESEPARRRWAEVDVKIEERDSDESDDAKIDEPVVEDDDDADDEMKNKYLANVLAFHGTNVPGILLHAYLARVLKYCPVTNEVFLLLLVYFDRIAKKANNFKKNDEESQMFVMDLYNIHRLIILGITVSSKFFSDIFYKNLRYAKVGGLPLEELNYLELQFLLLLDFKLMVSVEDLQNYADLLLRFWKREQLANELKDDSMQQ